MVKCYDCSPRDNTPEGLVKIHFYTGQITVDLSGAIDADVPPRWELFYEVIASDRCYAEDQTQCPPDPTYHDTNGIVSRTSFQVKYPHYNLQAGLGRILSSQLCNYFQITINITDINNKIPEPDHTRLELKVEIYENATSGDFVTTIAAFDLDRDGMWNILNSFSVVLKELWATIT